MDDYDDFDAPGPTTLTHGLTTRPAEAPAPTPPAADEDEGDVDLHEDPADDEERKRAADKAAAGPSSKAETARQLLLKAAESSAVDWFSNLTEDQLNRYELFKNTNLFQLGNKTQQSTRAKRVVQAILGGDRCVADGRDSLDRLVLVLSGVTKLFVADLVERGRMVSDERGHEGPLLPLHVAEAYERLVAENKVPGKKPAAKRRAFS